jgi:hypothetical protein
MTKNSNDSQDMKLFFENNPAEEHATTFKFSHIGRDDILIKCEFLQSEKAKDYNDALLIWDNMGMYLPQEDPPGNASTAFGDNNIYQTIDIQKRILYNTPYLIGLSVGKNKEQAGAESKFYKSVCATAFIPPVGNISDITYETTRIILTSEFGPQMHIYYKVPDGVKPKSYGHWIALFEGKVDTIDKEQIPVKAGDEPFEGIRLIERHDIAADSSSGEIIFDFSDGPLRYKDYSLGYFVGQDPTHLAYVYTVSTFNT